MSNVALVESNDPTFVEPPVACWLDRSRITRYGFEDRAFETGRTGMPVDRAYQFLARHCVGLKSGLLVKDAGVWKSSDSKDRASAELYQLYGGIQQGVAITAEKIRSFLGPDGGLVTFAGTGVFPGLAEFVRFDGHLFVNTWRDERIRGCASDIEAAEPLLKLIRENLCGQPPLSLDDMLNEALGSESSLVRYVLHWLAAVYQRPGYHIGTALWFVGSLKGAGKGTLVEAIRGVMGARWVGKTDESELDRGWNTFVREKLLMEADEFTGSSRRDLAKMFKELLGNPTISVATRHQGSTILPNIANWLFTTNNRHPIHIERGDRRHTFVETTDDPSRRAFAKAVRTALHGASRGRMLSGFAALLALIQVDDAILREPYDTPLRREITGFSDSPVARWFEDHDGRWRISTSKTATEAHRAFVEWASENDRRNADLSVRAFGLQMASLVAEQFVEKSRHKSAVQYRKVKYALSETPEIIASGGMQGFFADLDIFTAQQGDVVAAEESPTLPRAGSES